MMLAAFWYSSSRVGVLRKSTWVMSTWTMLGIDRWREARARNASARSGGTHRISRFSNGFPARNVQSAAAPQITRSNGHGERSQSCSPANPGPGRAAGRHFFSALSLDSTSTPGLSAEKFTPRAIAATEMPNPEKLHLLRVRSPARDSPCPYRWPAVQGAP